MRDDLLYYDYLLARFGLYRDEVEDYLDQVEEQAAHLKSRKRVVVGDEVLEDDGDGVDDQQGDDLDHAQQVQQTVHQRRQLNPRQVQHVGLLPILEDVVLNRRRDGGGPGDLLDEVILQFLDLLPLDDALQDVVLLEDEPAIRALALVHGLLHLVELLVEGQLALGVEAVVGVPLQQGIPRGSAVGYLLGAFDLLLGAPVEPRHTPVLLILHPLGLSVLLRRF